MKITNSQTFCVQPIGRIRSLYKQKFGVPRQPGLVGQVTGSVVLPNTDFYRQAIEGLEQFSHIWIQFLFHLVSEQESLQSRVRPPRAPDQKVGVYACRTPHRPNRLGLSLCKIGTIHFHSTEIEIPLFGVDLVDGTPVLDIKPYIAYSDSAEASRGGWTESAQSLYLPVSFSEEALGQCEGLSELEDLIKQTIEGDPRPQQQRETNKIFHLHLGEFDIQFEVKEQKATVLKVQKRTKNE
ncbi:MAG: tRNA (N6-threonylcarbamoyladenosine(37)-N6)-methyltransferase TrmO [Bdellovibrionales bacterium]|nr:tRNA (N6-threonylcarbamoyladenosine(37)-N6)-methyltransferase TrmO [Bdellovibrionales bacterium]